MYSKGRWQTFSGKSQVVNISDFVEMGSLLQLLNDCPCRKSAIGQGMSVAVFQSNYL